MNTAEFFLRAWDWKPPAVIGCCGLILLYGWALRFRFTARLALWLAGVLVILLALVSPLDELAGNYLFSIHMAKHILFVLVAPALLLAGLPAAPVERLLRYRPAAVLERLLNTPAVAWSAGIGAMILWHIPAVFQAAAAHRALHVVEPFSLLAGGTVFWWPIISPLPRARMQPVPQAVAYLFSACLACTAMGVTITFSPAALYPAFTHPADPYGILPLIRNGWGISPAMDQQIGGLLMWVPCCLIYLTAIMAMFARWYGQEAAEMEPKESMETQWT